MSDDTATVGRLRDYSPENREHIVHAAADLIEQQARTIAELREHKSESEDIIASLRHDLANPPGDVQELVLKTLGLWPCPFDMKAQLAEQAARLAECERDGWVLVPREPTQETLSAMEHIHTLDFADIYRAMIEASEP